MKPRSQRCREAATRRGIAALVFILFAIGAGSVGRWCQLEEILIGCLAAYCFCFLSVIGFVAMLLEAHDQMQAADREEYWENRSLRI